jgi:NAD(P)-dependent dehydrogenase (short-subunit alcohol dehydrogenase family)
VTLAARCAWFWSGVGPSYVAAAAGFAAGKRCARTPWAASFGAILLLHSEALKEALFLQLVDQTFIEKLFGRFGTPDEIAKAVVFLASEHASYITGIQLFVDGGVAQV